MDHRVTQCPRCGTSFRVTEAHLAVAAGAVRCGSCLHIFNARDHWADTAVAQAIPAPRQQQPEPDIDIDDDLLIDDNTPLFADDDDEPPAPARRPVFNAADDDFIALETAVAGHSETSDVLLDLDSWEQQSSSLFRELSDHDSEIPGADEQWAHRLLADTEREEPSLGAMAESIEHFDYAAIPADGTEVSEPASRAALEAELSREFLDVAAADSITAPKPAASHPRDQEPEEETAVTMMSIRADDRIGADVSQRLFEGFETEPLQLHQFAHEPVWPKVLWGAGLLLALALLAGQYLYFNFDTLARGPLRPRLAEFCSTFECSLPAQYDVGRIHTGSLIVRSHPTNPGALAVDTIITNQADFPQPYPELQLQFTDLDGAPVAGRRFKPEEYLGGELTGSRLMPVMQPVHIALELLDPGPRAVNYLLTVVPGTTAQ